MGSLDRGYLMAAAAIPNRGYPFLRRLTWSSPDVLLFQSAPFVALHSTATVRFPSLHLRSYTGLDPAVGDFRRSELGGLSSNNSNTRDHLARGPVVQQLQYSRSPTAPLLLPTHP